jgi:NADH-quinone oxidoreductase subunit H
MKFAMFFLAEYANMFAVSAIIVSKFFGGYHSPIGSFRKYFRINWFCAYCFFSIVAWFITKGMVFIFIQMWLRWTLPRLRVDQLMTLCWKYLIPYAFVNLIIVGIINLLK